MKRSILFSAGVYWYKYFTLLDLLTVIFYCALVAANVRDFKGNCTITVEKFFFRKLLFSKVCVTLLLKTFPAKQFNLITIYSICEIMNINADFRISWMLVVAYFKIRMKLKQKFVWKSQTYFCENTIDVCQNSEKSINVWWSWSSWKFFWGIKTTCLLGQCILWILNNPRFNN